MRKDLLTLVLLLVTLCGCSQQKEEEFVIRCKANGMADGISVGLLTHENMESEELATAVVKNGEFELRGKVSHPQLCTLVTNNLEIIKDEVAKEDYSHVHWTYTPVFVSNTEMTLNVTDYQDIPDEAWTDKFSITGGQPQADYTKYIQMTRGAGEDLAAQNKVAWTFIKDNPTSVVSLYLANNMLRNGYNLTLDSIKLLESYIKPTDADTLRYAQFRRNSELAEATAVGKPVVDLPMQDLEGKPFMLSEALPQGKIVLVDFWASWCGICRAGTPAIKECAKRHPESFAVIGVSTDENLDKWKKAVEEEDCPWPQYVLTPEGAKDFYEKYQTVGVPYYIIIDTEGHVIANPGGTDAAVKMIDRICE